MTATLKQQQCDESTSSDSAAAINKLTDEAVTKRIAAIGRLIKTQTTYREDAQNEIDILTAEKNLLIQAKIDRLRAQLPAQLVDATKDGEQ